MAPPDRQPPAAAPAARHGWLSRLIRATVGAGLVAAVLAGAALPWWLSSPERLSRIVAAAVPELEGTVSFDRVRLGWTGPIVLQGVKVTPRDGGRPPLTIDRIEGTHGLLAMLFSAGDLGHLAIGGLAVELAFDEKHRTNLERLFAAKQPPRAATPARPRRSAVRMRLDVQDAVVRISAPWTIEPWESEPISIRAALAPVADGWSEWTVEPVQLLADARMEPAVAWGVLAYIAPVLADATRTSGRFSLALDGARLPVGDPAAGTLSGVLAMHEVVLGPGPLVTSLFESLPGGLPRPPTIRIAEESRVRFRLAERKVWHEGLEFGVPLPDPGKRLDVTSSGAVSLGDRALDLKLVLPIPADAWQDRPLLGALAGKRISLGVAGNLEKPQVVFDGSIRETAGQVAADWLDRIRGTPPGPRQVPPPGPPAAAPAGAEPPPAGAASEAIVDIVGDVLEEVARRRAERRAAEAAGEPPPPRRGRLLDRLRPPPVDRTPAAPAAGE